MVAPRYVFKILSMLGILLGGSDDSARNDERPPEWEALCRC